VLTQEKHCTQLQNDIESVKEVMKANERHLAQFQNMMDLVKMIKVGDECFAQLLNHMDLMEEAMMAEGKHRAQIQKEMHSMKVVERWFSVPMEQMVGNSASMDNVGYQPGGSRVNMHTQKLGFSKTQEVHAKVVQGGLTNRAAVCG
jgi:hypothetical protein